MLLLPHAFFWPLPEEPDDPGKQHLGVTAEENKDPSQFPVLLLLLLLSKPAIPRRS